MPNAPEVASSLLVQGRIFSQTNLFGEGTPNLHPSVRQFVDARRPLGTSEFLGTCAEIVLVSDQFWGLDEQFGQLATIETATPHFEGAAIFSRKIRPDGDPENGTPSAPCAVCKDVLDTLGIRILLG